MASPLFESGRPNRPLSWLATMAAAVVILGAVSWSIYTQFRIDVGTGEVAVLIRKTGKDLSNNDEIAPDPSYKGVQRKTLEEGRYFYNPFGWEWQIHKQVEIPKGGLGVRVSLTGDDLPYGEFLARANGEGDIVTKGIVPEVLRPGRYPNNPYLFKVETHSPVTIDAGYKGVVTNLAGPMPAVANQLLVAEGERGVQKAALDPGTYYINPYVTRISQVDCRSQRLNLAEEKDMGFPTKDGFWVSLDGVIEFRVNPERAAEVFVLYNDGGNGESLDEELIRKAILPNARSFCRLQGSNELGREFIQGLTRTEFQEHFQQSMQTACEPLGIEVIQALITRIHPPQQIAGPVRDREIAKQQEKKFQQQILQQQAEQQLAIEQELVNQKQALVQSQQEVVRLTIEALTEQGVAVTKAEERLAVAELTLAAAKDEAAAILARGNAEAEVIGFQNRAEAAGWQRSVDAFSGNGSQFAQYVLYQKMATAYRSIMVNTADSPIMRIFESFAPDQVRSPGSPEVRSAGLPPAADPTGEAASAN